MLSSFIKYRLQGLLWGFHNLVEGNNFRRAKSEKYIIRNIWHTASKVAKFKFLFVLKEQKTKWGERSLDILMIQINGVWSYTHNKKSKSKEKKNIIHLMRVVKWVLLCYSRMGFSWVSKWVLLCYSRSLNITLGVSYQYISWSFPMYTVGCCTPLFEEWWFSCLVYL